MAKKIVVIGGGAAGLMAALTAGKQEEVYILEKMKELGKSSL